MLWHLAAVILGVVALYFGGEWLVSGSTALAARLSVARSVVGLTVVAFGTSAPELAATLTAAFAGSPEVAYGNVVGSNIANVGLILGAAALLAPMTTSGGFLWRQLPVMLGVTVIGLGLAWNGNLTRIEGLLLLTLLAGYLWMTLRGASEQAPVAAADGILSPDRPVEGRSKQSPRSCWFLIVAGIVALTLGARVLIFGASEVALVLGISNRIIGLTLVAVGTSIPELAAALAASAKREYDLVLGNVVGSNVFNILAVLGATSLTHPFEFGTPTSLEVTAVVGLPLVMLALMAPRLRIGRSGGLLLLATYSVYLWMLFWGK